MASGQDKALWQVAGPCPLLCHLDVRSCRSERPRGQLRDLGEPQLRARACRVVPGLLSSLRATPGPPGPR